MWWVCSTPSNSPLSMCWAHVCPWHLSFKLSLHLPSLDVPWSTFLPQSDCLFLFCSSSASTFPGSSLSLSRSHRFRSVGEWCDGDWYDDLSPHLWSPLYILILILIFRDPAGPASAGLLLILPFPCAWPCSISTSSNLVSSFCPLISCSPSSQLLSSLPLHREARQASASLFSCSPPSSSCNKHAALLPQRRLSYCWTPPPPLPPTLTMVFLFRFFFGIFFLLFSVSYHSKLIFVRKQTLENIF